VVKNKVAPPFRQAEFDIMYGEGISREGSVLDLSVEHEIIKKSGAWYTYEGEQMGQGRENAKRFLRENPEIMVEITNRVMSTLLPSEEEKQAAIDAAAAEEAEGFSESDEEPITLE